MAQKIITNLQCVISSTSTGSNILAYVPNTLKYTGSTAETKVTTVTTGGNSATSVHSMDVSGATSMVKFEVRATTQILENIDDWYKDVGEVIIELSSVDGSIAEAYTGMSLVSKPEIGLGAEESFELEFRGDAK